MCEIIPFRRCPIRAWVVIPTDDGRWLGRIVGRPPFVKSRTEVGEMWAVLECLKGPEARHGLPIIEFEARP